ncbi:DUF6763 family protein [Sulfuriflexus sp.]|uniref:DUF6763 family protein n=1 Tax=Sulfuriflexus sp. TaxID=2015443 RepID=UPI0028CDD490|nr:DUF6763 family protein [Sulfuriflexus sp.]MDT8405175.1 DUF6763 family protein [Sulfuriflexus sp.]
MSFTAEPIAGEWYHDNELDQDFEIISVDEYEGLIEILREGAEESEEISLDDWDDLLVEPADSPLRDSRLENDFVSDADFIDEDEVEETSLELDED